ncbi:hypothetical protein SLW56_17055 [Xanthomonas sp. LF07-6]|uniref:hypothetical protein n=1 Tax=Xanthomonas sp. LF07-6 TaxID=3097550 RepID=UPI002A8196D4|nr:hypothetical protein [Xanthomonas sp. LF07-6]MDY4341498.1 hypothetical protein [Xanthomonas sp. LF07-6]
MASDRGSVVAERVLLFSESSNKELKEFRVRIFSPTKVEPGDSNARIDDGAAKCLVEFLGISVPGIYIYGIDHVHALKQAADVDLLLKGIANKYGYNFFWGSGEPYFED